MKIPEPAPDWQEHLTGNPVKKKAQLKEVLAKANKEYLYWDKFKYLDFPEGIPEKEAWAVLKVFREARPLRLEDTDGAPFSYGLPATAQEAIHLIDRGMEKVITEVLTGQVAKEYQLNSIMEEAIASSQIEGAATTRPVAKEMLRTGRTPKDHGEKMILNNFRTINKLKGFLEQPLTPELIKEIHKSMTLGTLENPAWEGAFRAEQNEVQDIDQKVLFMPPSHTEIDIRIGLMCQFVNEEEDDNFIHPVIKGIILHFWLAYVHPFMDGNGRTARALFYWYMLKHGYWLFECLSISSVINKKRNQYLKAFLYSEIDDNDLTYFIMFHLRAIEVALDEVVAYIKRKKEEKKGAMDFLKMYPILNDRQLAILADALEKPEATYTYEKHARVHSVVRQSARTDLLALQDLGLLDMRKEGRKFIFTPSGDLREKLHR